MARNESDAKTGFYPLDEDWTKQLSRLIKPMNHRGRLLDPFGGQGTAAITLADAWNCDLYLMEIQEENARIAQEKLGNVRAIHGDSYSQLNAPHRGFSIVYLNPNFSHDPNEPETSRTEYKALKHFSNYAQAGGIVVWTVYSHHINQNVANFLLKTFASIYLFYFGDRMHLDEYRMIAVVGIKPVNEKEFSPDIVEEATLKIMEIKPYGKTNPEKAQKWRDIRKGMGKNPYWDGDYVVAKIRNKDTGEYERQEIPDYRLPSPAPLSIRNWHFSPKHIDIPVATELNKKYGAQNSSDFKKLVEKPFVPPPPQPIARPRDRQLAVAIAAGMTDNVTVLHKNKPSVLRGSVQTLTKIVSSESEIDDKGREHVIETAHTFPSPKIVVLDVEGTVEDITDDVSVVEFIGEHVARLMAYFEAKYQPLYDMCIHPFWGVTYDEYRLKGKHQYLPTQEYFSVAMTEYILFNPMLIVAAEMGFGKTALGITTMINLRRFELERQNGSGR